jgi:hypothetical protein
MKRLRSIVLMLSLFAVLFGSVVVNAAPPESQVATVAAADSTISFTIRSAPRTSSVMLQKQQRWDWVTLDYRHGSNWEAFKPFSGLGAGTYRVQIKKGAGWETCSPTSLNVNGSRWSNATATCIGG